MHSGALFTENTVVCAYIFGVIMDIGVGIETVRTLGGVQVSIFFPVVVFSTV
jgi:hypothetical protein